MAAKTLVFNPFLPSAPVQLNVDMKNAIEQCRAVTGRDLPSHLKITSISSRHTNLQHSAQHLLLSLVTKPSPVTTTRTTRRGSKVLSRSDSASASELAIREELNSLKSCFSEYKKVFESRYLSSSGAIAKPSSSHESVSPVLMETRAHLRSPPIQENGHAPLSSSSSVKFGLGGGVDSGRAGEELKAELKYKTSSLGRSSTVGVWWSGRPKGPGPGGSSVDVKEKVAVLNERSKDDAVPIQELGTTFGPRKRARSAGSATIRKIMQDAGDPTPAAGGGKGSEVGGRRPNVTVDDSVTRRPAVATTRQEAEPVVVRRREGPEEGGVVLRRREGPEEGGVVLRRREGPKEGGVVLRRKEGPEEGGVVLRRREGEGGVAVRRREKGLSRAERSRKIEDIKKLFETSEIEEQLGISAESAHGWSPREYDIKATPPHGVVTHDNRDKNEDISGRGVAAQDHTPTSPPPAIMVSPPPPEDPVMVSPLLPSDEPRGRVNTAPTIIRTVIKDRTPPAKKQVITITMDSAPATPPTKDADSSKQSVDDTLRGTKDSGSAHSPSPLIQRRATHDASSPASLLRGRGKERDLLRGKVSTLRDLFDAQSRGAPSNTPSNRPTAAKPSNKDSLQSDLLTSATISSATPTSQSQGAGQDSFAPPTTDHQTPEKEQVKECSPPRPHLPSPSVLSPAPYTPPPRPPPPQGYYDPATPTPTPSTADQESESESDPAESESGSSLLGDDDLQEWTSEEWAESLDSDEYGTDESDSGPMAVPRPLKSLRKVLSDLLTSELTYLKSLEVLVEVYLTHLTSSPHVPSFLQSAHTTVFPHTTALYNFQR